MRSLLLSACATTLILLAEFAQAAPAEQSWEGTVRCDVMPGTSLPLVQRIQLRVTGARALYEREVRVADTGTGSGIWERATGTVGRDGRLTLTGSATGNGYTYTARYSGRLPPAGGQTTLEGNQLWVMRNGNTFDRPCRIELRR